MWSLIVVLLDEAGDATPSLRGISIPFHPDLFFLQSAMETLYQADTGGVTIADSNMLEMAAVPQVLQEALGGHLRTVVGDRGDFLRQGTMDLDRLLAGLLPGPEHILGGMPLGEESNKHIAGEVVYQRDRVVEAVGLDPQVSDI